MRTKGFVNFTIANSKMFFREKEVVFWTFLFPILIMGLLGLAFGNVQDVSYDVGLVDNDMSSLSENFTGVLKNASYFKIKILSEAAANETLKKGDLDIVVFIPKNFGNDTISIISSIQAGGGPGNPNATQNSTGGNPTVYVFYSSSYQGRSDSAMAIINAIIGGMNKNLTQSKDVIGINKNSVSTVKLEFIDYMAPGIIAMAAMQTGVYAMSVPVVQMREKKVLRRLRVTPITPSYVLLSRIALSLAICLLQALIILLIAIFAFNLKIVGSWLTLSVITLIGSIAFVGVGFLISAVAKTSESASGLASVISMPMMFLGDVFIPIKQFPDYIQTVSKCMPLTYMSDALRRIVVYGSGIGDILLDVGVLVVLGAIVFFVAIKTFRWE